MIFKNKRIMIVGWFNPKFSAEGIAQGFESNGFEVIRVASDEEMPKDSGKFDYHLLEYYISVLPYKNMNVELKGRYTSDQLNEICAIQSGRRLFYLKWIVDKIKKPIDLILIIQYENPPSIEGIDIPIGYYYTETCDPSLPLGRNIDFLFYAFNGGLSKLSRIYPFWKQQWSITKLIPHAINKENIPKDVKPLANRKNIIGFKGLLDFNTLDKNPLVKYIYAERKQYINFLFKMNEVILGNKIKRFFKKTKAPFIYERNTNWNDYANFMNETQLAINIPGVDGLINQRQYEALGFGCVLLQYYYDELIELGFYGDPIKFPDKCNCLWFRNEQELLDRYDWYMNNPEKAKYIAYRGRKWLLESDQTWQGRANLMLNELTKDPNIDEEFGYELKIIKNNEEKRNMMEKLHNATFT